MDQNLSNKKNSNNEQRLVHLDLKGAPPKISYYEWLFPMIKKWGATGLLIEYEDMFPYYGEFSQIPLKYAYSIEEIKHIQLIANFNQLKIIPLIQTVGHMEFVLKHDKFRSYREIELYPMTLCLNMEESSNLVFQMIEQLIGAHPESEYLHIGADEVYHVGMCQRCVERIELHSLTPTNFFLDYLQRLLNLITTNYPKLKVIAWDDMFRNMNQQMLKNSGIGDCLHIMVWYYQPTIDLPPDIWQAYSLIFNHIWVASAYKGATGPCAVATDIGIHVENQKAWLLTVSKYIDKLNINFEGYVLTGWQRYDHYAILCELLPVAIPSLAICLNTITVGAFTVDVHKKASTDLNFKNLIPMNPFLTAPDEGICKFPGSEIYCAIHSFIQLKTDFINFKNNERLQAWMTRWHVNNNYSNPAHILNFLPLAQNLLDNCVKLSNCLHQSLLDVFYEQTVSEWLEVNIRPMVAKLQKIISVGNQQVQLAARCQPVLHNYNKQ